jgi:hypothetical protein
LARQTGWPLEDKMVTVTRVGKSVGLKKERRAKKKASLVAAGKIRFHSSSMWSSEKSSNLKSFVLYMYCTCSMLDSLLRKLGSQYV